VCRPDDDPPTASRTRWRALHGRLLLLEDDPTSARADLERALAVWERQAGREAAIASALVAMSACLRAPATSRERRSLRPAR